MTISIPDGGSISGGSIARQVERDAQLSPDLAETALVGPLEAGRVVLGDGGLNLDTGALGGPVQQLGVEGMADTTPARLRERPRLDRRRARLRVPADKPDPGADVGAVVGGDEPGHVPGLLAPVLEIGRVGGVCRAQGVPDGEQAPRSGASMCSTVTIGRQRTPLGAAVRGGVGSTRCVHHGRRRRCHT